MKTFAISLLLLLISPCIDAQPLPHDLETRLVHESLWEDGSSVRFLEGDDGIGAVRPLLDSARSTVESFFGAPFPEPIAITVVPDREAFTAVLREAWGVPETACWMVATAVADFAVILSPSQWADEACEHDASDRQHVEDIITHELTHTYHGQSNPTRDFTGAEEVGWFLEGLAVVVAGQLHRDRLSDPAEAVSQGEAPARLADAWSGQYRYGVSGSLVQYIDETHGREAIRELLPATTQAELLGVLGLEERDLLKRWEAWVRSQ